MTRPGDEERDREELATPESNEPPFASQPVIESETRKSSPSSLTSKPEGVNPDGRTGPEEHAVSDKPRAVPILPFHHSGDEFDTPESRGLSVSSGLALEKTVAPLSTVFPQLGLWTGLIGSVPRTTGAAGAESAAPGPVENLRKTLAELASAAFGDGEILAPNGPRSPELKTFVSDVKESQVVAQPREIEGLQPHLGARTPPGEGGDTRDKSQPSLLRQALAEDPTSADLGSAGALSARLTEDAPVKATARPGSQASPEKNITTYSIYEDYQSSISDAGLKPVGDELRRARSEPPWNALPRASFQQDRTAVHGTTGVPQSEETDPEFHLSAARPLVVPGGSNRGGVSNPDALPHEVVRASMRPETARYAEPRVEGNAASGKSTDFSTGPVARLSTVGETKAQTHGVSGTLATVLQAVSGEDSFPGGGRGEAQNPATRPAGAHSQAGGTSSGSGGESDAGFGGFENFLDTGRGGREQPVGGWHARPEVLLDQPGSPPEPRSPDAAQPAQPATPTVQRSTTAESLSEDSQESSGLDRARSVDRLVEMASLQKKLDSHRMDLWLQDERMGRVSLRLTERAGLVDAMLRTDNIRGRELLVESLPALFESLARRGLQASYAENSAFGSDRQQPFEHPQGNSRRPRNPFSQRRRGSARFGPVLRLETE